MTPDDIIGRSTAPSAPQTLLKTLSSSKTDAELTLQKMAMSLRYDPAAFCNLFFPWGKGELAGSDGLRGWQNDIAQTIGKHLQDPKTRHTPLQIAVASGHGIGKSSLVSMLIDWALSTCVGAKVVVTANTENQLRTKTWPEVTKWVRNSANAHWFENTATAVMSTEKDQVLNWRADAIPWSENNTEAFAGLHNAGKRLVLIFDEACHDEETEVLTDSGWKFFKDLSAPDKLLTMNRETRNAEYLRPTALHASHRSGEMLKYKIKGVDFKITPNHRMWVRSQKGDWSFRDAGALASRANLEVYVPRHVLWNAPDKVSVTVPALVTDRKIYPQLDLPADKMLELLGWYCSEGHLTASCGRYRVVGFTQQNTSHIAALCEELGFSPKRYNECSTPQVRVHNTQFAEWVAQWGVGCKTKGVPDFVRTCSARQIGIFLDAYTAGDGYRRGKEDVIYTSSKKMADGLHELCYLAGQKSTMAKRSLEGKPIKFKTHNAASSCDGYAISRSWSGTDIALKTRLLEKVHYDGMVYCATLPKHEMLFTRRNGVCLWSGNSAISDKVWEVAEGAMTDADTEIIWLAFGNPTQNTGRFRECFGKFKHRWVTRQIDSRTVDGTNKAQIQTWIDDYGEDSDFVRVRVRGEFPRSGNLQFISSEVVELARKRSPEAKLWDARVMGVDVARFGSDESVICFRQGRDARSNKWIKLRNVDTMAFAAHIVDAARWFHPDAIFVDGGGVGGGVVDRLRQLRQPVFEVQFGGAPDRAVESGEGAVHYVNKRAEMWGNMKDWLRGGSIPDDPDLVQELTSVQYGYLFKEGIDKIILEKKVDMKKRGLSSPDAGDALALTFAYPVMPSDHRDAFETAVKSGHKGQNYNPYAIDRVRNM